MGDTFLPTLTVWQWTILAAIPPLMVLLYFLKLKRHPLEVPSTFLWHRTVEDLHVNAIWQRLRQNLLLFLQLLFIALLIFALLRPGWQGKQVDAQRVIFLIDTSASMSAGEAGKTRLDEAKRQALDLVDALRADTVAMIISFSDVARVEQTFTENTNMLRAKLRAIEPTAHLSSLDEALRAASGLANPGRTGNAEEGDVPAANPLPATLYVITDGGFAKIPNFALGTLEPKYVKIGEGQPQNVAITAFTTERNPEKPGRLQAFGRIENFSSTAITTNASLFLDGQLLDAQEVNLGAASPGPGVAGVHFELADESEGALRLELDLKDDLAIDNSAFAVLNSPRPARVLIVTSNDSSALRWALTTEEAQKVSQTTFMPPSRLESKQYADDAAAGVYDLIIFDRCSPKTPPQANTLYLGAMPPGETWPASEKQGQATVIDIDRVHPLTQLVEMSNVIIARTGVLTPPKGGLTLIEADVGPLYSIAPRQSFEDAVLGFSLLATNDAGEDEPATDWPRQKSFPVFMMNAVKYLGGVAGQGSLTSVHPGEAYPIRTVLPVEAVTVKTPAGDTLNVRRENQNVINFTDTATTGVYDVREGTGTKLGQQFVVNLFDARESDLRPAETLPIGHEKVEAETVAASASARKELWKWILMLGLGIVLFEWWVYNRRVYL